MVSQLALVPTLRLPVADPFIGESKVIRFPLLLELLFALIGGCGALFVCVRDVCVRWGDKRLECGTGACDCLRPWYWSRIFFLFICCLFSGGWLPCLIGQRLLCSSIWGAGWGLGVSHVVGVALGAFSFFFDYWVGYVSLCAFSFLGMYLFTVSSLFYAYVYIRCVCV